MSSSTIVSDDTVADTIKRVKRDFWCDQLVRVFILVMVIAIPPRFIKIQGYDILQAWLLVLYWLILEIWDTINDRRSTSNQVPEAPKEVMEKISVAPEELSEEGVDID
ncbi:hypothetical protein G7Y79_00041g077790 [Physcia stellaris]|nr:hypothetical protein G7Y79_00041g077790 [Physcia stellaris]